MELINEYEVLPDWNANLIIMFDLMTQLCIVELPLELELGKEKVIDFMMKYDSPENVT